MKCKLEVSKEEKKKKKYFLILFIFISFLLAHTFDQETPQSLELVWVLISPMKLDQFARYIQLRISRRLIKKLMNT